MIKRKISLPYSNKIGDFYKSQRESSGLSQNDVAVKLDINKQLVSNWERGMCSPKAQHLPLLIKLTKIQKKKLYSLLQEAQDKELKKALKI